MHKITLIYNNYSYMRKILEKSRGLIFYFITLQLFIYITHKGEAHQSSISGINHLKGIENEKGISSN